MFECIWIACNSRITHINGSFNPLQVLFVNMGFVFVQLGLEWFSVMGFGDIGATEIGLVVTVLITSRV